MLKKFIQIIKGNLNRITGKEQQLYTNRYYGENGCNSCPNNSRGKTKLLGFIPIKDEICNICLCPLKSKLRVDNSECPIGRWKAV